jgi:hypothetical protein
MPRMIPEAQIRIQALFGKGLQKPGAFEINFGTGLEDLSVQVPAS